MTGTAKPGNFIQFPLFMPASLDGFGMHLPWDKMVVGQGNPAALTNLARGGSSVGPDRGRCGYGEHIVL